MRRVAIVVVLGLAGSAAAAPDFDASFREAATQLGVQQDRFVTGWGTARLDGSKTPHRFATLMPADGMGRGAYLIEQAPNVLWLVTFNADGRTQPFVGGSGVPESKVPWSVLNDTAIPHTQGHHHGGESLALAFRATSLVITSYSSTGDVTDTRERTIEHAFPRATAPLAATFYTRDSQLAIVGPARSVSALVEPVYSALHIDWDHVSPKTDAETLALWQRIAPTGEDLEKLGNIPEGGTQLRLAIAILRGGNFTCPAAPQAARCKHVHELETPASTAGLGDRCVRRGVALWALGVLGQHEDQVAKLADTLRAIAKLLPPEDALVDAAIEAGSADPMFERELAGLAWRSGHHDSVRVDRALATEADTALAALIGDPVKVVKTGDCATAALAAVVRERTGDFSLVPKRPATRDAGQMTRQLCVLAHYDLLGGTHASLVDFIGMTGFALVHRGNSEELGADEPHLPETFAMARCSGTTCITDDLKLQLSYAVDHKQLALSKIEITDRPTCR